MAKLLIYRNRFIMQFFPTLRSQVLAVAFAGGFVGLCAYLVYVSKAYSYLSDDPEVCINCHVMGPYYATWQHSSHASVATCNDCHVPHTSIFAKYYFKATDGLRHSTDLYGWISLMSQLIIINRALYVNKQQEGKICAIT